MSPARVDGESSAMAAAESRKRPAEAEDSQPISKKHRASLPRVILSAANPAHSEHSSNLMTPEELARQGLRRGIALSLQKVGFESATPDAMEGFTVMVEKYLSSMVENVKTLANVARRSHPVPKDFEESLKRFNLTTALLNPQRKPPIPRSKRLPAWEPLDMDDSVQSDLPILSDELDGAPDKDAKNYIPSPFPPFPSIHTYKYTPESIATVSVLKEPPPLTAETASLEPNGSQRQQRVEWPLAPNEIPHGDPKKMREAAAKEAKAGEAALRKLMRASKVASQKESWVSAQREPARRERYELWESTMRELIPDDARSKGQEIAPAEMHGEKGREGIADHSMIVNAEKKHHRRETMRAGARKVAIAGDAVLGKG